MIRYSIKSMDSMGRTAQQSAVRSYRGRMRLCLLDELASSSAFFVLPRISHLASIILAASNPLAFVVDLWPAVQWIEKAVNYNEPEALTDSARASLAFIHYRVNRLSILAAFTSRRGKV